MANRNQLRELRTNTIINENSKKQETELDKALSKVVYYLENRFVKKITLTREKQWYLKDIINELRPYFPDIDLHCHSKKTNMKPDGGILTIKSIKDSTLTYPILISEVKRQGTNDSREEEGQSKQSKGNAIERLGKNLIGFRTALLRESIFPFVCFGHGCDFEEGSSTLDKVSTMAMFGKLNKTYLYNEEDGRFNRGSFYFRAEEWTVDEMFEIMKDIAERAVLYYFSKYREDHFTNSSD
ncbi:restriction endonuclease [Candidatus Poribacteria bacterium]|nr:MAG: restriction endonuclease [Candidatus Poribacteria bacterium]